MMVVGSFSLPSIPHELAVAGAGDDDLGLFFKHFYSFLLMFM